MYGSYGSYSSMCAVQMTAPMDISGASSFSTSSSHQQQASSCAFPSWPRRSSLSDEAGEYRATSYLSDEDLFPTDAIDDDARSVSSAGSGGSLLASPAAGPAPLTDEELLEMQRERQAHQRELVRFLMLEKERLRRQRKQRRSSSTSSSSSSSSSKKGSKSKLSTVAEAGGE